MKRFGLCLLLMPAVLGAAGGAELSCWTNRVGRVVEAVPLREQSRRFDLRMVSGKVLTVPAAAFPESEQTRLRLALGRVPLPPELAELWDFCSEMAHRQREFCSLGRKTPDERDSALEALRRTFREAVLRRHLPPAHEKALLKKAGTL